MKNNLTPPQWVVDDVQPMLQCSNGACPTVTAHAGAVTIDNMLNLANYPIQGVLVEGHYE